MPVQTISEVTPDELYVSMASWIVESIATVCNAKGHCVLGIVGGRSIPSLLEKLLPYTSELSSRIELFWLDERIASDKVFPSAVPALEALHEAGVNIRWHPLQSTTIDTMEADAHIALQQLIAASGSPTFDVIILSAGEDGHIASLFPHRPSLDRNDLSYLIESQAPKLPAARVTASPALLLSAKYAFLLFVGDKQAAYDLFLIDGPIADCPARLVKTIEYATVCTCLNPP